MLIVSFDLPKPSQKQEIIEILEKAKIIPSLLSTKLSGVARFRNLLVHEYVKIDRDMVYQILSTRIPELEGFARSVTKYLKKKRYI